MSDTPGLSLLFHTKDNPALVLSGYGKIAQYVTPMLMDAGYDVRLHCTVGHTMNTITWTEPHSGRSMDIWCGGSGAYGEDIIPLHLQKLTIDSKKPAMVLFCGDAVALDQLPKMARSRQVLAAAWAAVDWEWPSPNHVLEKFSSFLGVWPMSHHGGSVLQQDGLPNLLPPVWCGVNTDLWKPIDRSEMPKTMKSMGFRDDGFNVFSCFANQFQRKGEYEMLSAIGEFHRRHPEAKVHFYGLTQVRREWDLYALVHHLGIQDLVTLSSDYEHLMGGYTEEDVCRMMNAADVVMHLGYEGFGLQAVEAQAINKPVIGFNAGATPELMCSGHALVPPVKEIMVPAMFRRPLPDAGKVVEALEYVYQHRDEKWRWAKGRPWVQGRLTWKHCGQGLVERLRAVEQRIADEEIIGPPMPGPRAVDAAKETVVVE